MFGLNDSGKTKILYKLALDEDVMTIPTMGFNVETIKFENYEKDLQIYDVAGNEKVRSYCQHYISDEERTYMGL